MSGSLKDTIFHNGVPLWKLLESEARDVRARRNIVIPSTNASLQLQATVMNTVASDKYYFISLRTADVPLASAHVDRFAQFSVQMASLRQSRLGQSLMAAGRAFSTDGPKTKSVQRASFAQSATHIRPG